MPISGEARPRIKHVFPWFSIDDKIFVQRCGSVLQIDDPTGLASRIFKLLDGTRTCSEVREALAADFPHVTLGDVIETVEQLDAEAIVEDGAVAPPDDPYILQRFIRDLGFLETYATLTTSKYELHRKLRECRVGLLGIGGVGSHILYDLLGLGIEDVRAVDYDRVEISNLNRQILYRESDLGRLKTEVAVERASEYAPRARVETAQIQLTCADDVYQVVADRDVVIVTTDQPKMQIIRWVNAGCVRAGVTMLAGGVDMQRSVFYTIIPGQTGCVECWRAQSAGRDSISARVSAELTRIEATFSPGERFGQDMAAFGPLVTCHTASLITELVRITTGIVPPVASGRLMEVRFDDFTVREVESWQRAPECETCGPSAHRASDRGVAVTSPASVAT